MRGYRAWDVANKEMLYPDGNGYFGSEHHLSFVIDGNGKPIYIDDMGTPVEIIFLQQIGLKDKNGKELYYDSDIIILPGSDKKWKAIKDDFDIPVFVADEGVTIVDFRDYFMEMPRTSFEIIGDIYTTPDLKEQS